MNPCRFLSSNPIGVHNDGNDVLTALHRCGMFDSYCSPHLCFPTVRSCDRCPARDQIHGPGSILAEIFATIGIPKEQCETCQTMAKRMDELGPEGCQAKRETLIAQLRDRAKQFPLGLWEQAKIACAAAREGLATKINWFDPMPGFLDEAILRATEAREAWLISTEINP